MIRHPLLAVVVALLLAAATVLSGPVTAQAQGITVELCADAGTVTVTLDPAGRPVMPHRRCPLCLAAQDMTLAPGPAAWSRPARAAQAAPQAPAEPLPRATHPAMATARGPPLPV